MRIEYVIFLVSDDFGIHIYKLSFEIKLMKLYGEKYYESQNDSETVNTIVVRDSCES